MSGRKRRGRRVNATGRSEGVDPYMIIPYVMLHSAAWRSLSGAAVKVWLELRTRYHGTGTNGRLHLSLDEAARILGMGKATIARALRELEEKGFIVVTRKGQWYGRLATEYAVTDQSLDGANPTRAWTQWRPDAARPSVPRRNIKTEIGSEAAP